MKERVPYDWEVEDAVRDVLRRIHRVESQAELRRLIIETLSDAETTVRLTAVRARRIAVTSGAAVLEIDYRSTEKDDVPEICPICRNAMNVVRTMNLDGDVVELKRRCTVCPFTSAGTVRIPARYAFVRPESDECDDRDKVRLIRNAAAHLRAAKRLITEALEGTSISGRARYANEMIDAVLSSKNEPGSMKNLESDLEEEEGPLWTRPLDSPKKAHGNDY